MSGIRSVAGKMELGNFLSSVRHQVMDNAGEVLHIASELLLKYVKSYTNQLAPPDSQHRNVRHTHPGGWADVSHDLQDKYFSSVQLEGNAWTMTIGNNSAHAVYVEARDGFLVVHGLTEVGGPVEQAIRRAARLANKGWKVHVIGEIDPLGDNARWENLDEVGFNEATGDVNDQ